LQFKIINEYIWKVYLWNSSDQNIKQKRQGEPTENLIIYELIEKKEDIPVQRLDIDSS
jgi:hypothetical protein